MEPCRLERERVIATAYGRPESGKTYQIRSLIEAVGAERVFVISLDRGLKPLLDLKPLTIEIGISGDLLAEFDAALLYLERNAKAYDWWAVDGIGRVSAEVEARALAGIDRDDPKQIRAVQRAYGTVWAEQRNRLSRLHRLPMNGYLTLLEESRDEVRRVLKIDERGTKRLIDEPTGNTQIHPVLAGRKVEDFFPALCDTVIRCFTRQVVNRKVSPISITQGFFGLTQRDGLVTARIRTAPSRPIPKEVCFGRRTVDGGIDFNPETDWTVARLVRTVLGEVA